VREYCFLFAELALILCLLIRDTKSASFEELAEYQKELDEVERLQYKLSAKYLEEFGLPLSILG